MRRPAGPPTVRPTDPLADRPTGPSAQQCTGPLHVRVLDSTKHYQSTQKQLGGPKDWRAWLPGYTWLLCLAGGGLPVPSRGLWACLPAHNPFPRREGTAGVSRNPRRGAAVKCLQPFGDRGHHRPRRQRSLRQVLRLSNPKPGHAARRQVGGTAGWRAGASGLGRGRAGAIGKRACDQHGRTYSHSVFGLPERRAETLFAGTSVSVVSVLCSPIFGVFWFQSLRSLFSPPIF
jgi:hypothetical protein